MDVGLHHVTDSFINHSMPPYDRQACKSFRDEQYGEVPMPAGGTRMASVQVAVIRDPQFGRLQCGAQA